MRLQFDPKSHHRTLDNSSSIAAAYAQVDKATKAQRKVLRYLIGLYSLGVRIGLEYSAGATDDIGQERTGMYSYRRRRADLKNQGLVMDSGRKSMGPRGVLMTVWTITPLMAKLHASGMMPEQI